MAVKAIHLHRLIFMRLSHLYLTLTCAVVDPRKVPSLYRGRQGQDLPQPMFSRDAEVV